MIYALYLSSLIVSVVVAAALVFYFWRRRSMTGAVPAAWVMMATAIFSLGYVLQLISNELSGQILATDIQYVGIAALPVAWFAFSLRYTDHDKWLTSRNLLLLAIIPSVTVVLAWTNSFHSLMWQGRHLESSGPFVIIAKTYGPWFWVHTLYSYVLIILGMLVLVQRLFRPPRLYREQSIALLISVVVPLGWNVVYVFNLAPVYRIDLTPSAFTISGLAMAWGLFRLRLFDIIPMARDAVIENISDGVIVLDTQNRLIDINPAAQRIIGYSLSDVIGQPFARVLPQQPELVERSNVRMVEALLEIVIEKGETRYYYELHISPIYGRHDRLAGRFIILHDVTEHKLIEARRKELEDRAHIVSRLSTLGELAAGIAHEINNPLASVISYANWLLERDIPDDIKGDLEVINRGAKRAGDILDRLLTFAGQRHVEWDYLDINRILEITTEFRKHSLSNNNIEVIKQFDPGLPKTMADGGQLQEVFLNLIINAETSMTESHSGGRLIIKTETANDNIRICFKDDGAGISEETINKIFDPFFTTKEVGKGTGLGLSICHGIINEHGGRIYAESELGKGATFFVELPIVISTEQLKLTEPIVESERVSGDRILVVDDEPIVQQFLSEMLSGEGHKVVVIDNGNDALEKLGSEDFDVILLNIKLPGKSGIEIYKHLQKAVKSLVRKVIFITGDAMDEDIAAFLSRTKASYISKPFDVEQLKNNVNRVLSGRA